MWDALVSVWSWLMGVPLMAVLVQLTVTTYITGMLVFEDLIEPWWRHRRWPSPGPVFVILWWLWVLLSWYAVVPKGGA